MIGNYKPGVVESVKATAAITKRRLVGIVSGAHCGAAARPLGVAEESFEIGEYGPVIINGTALAEAGAAVAAGAALQSDANGKVVTNAMATVADLVGLVGYALEAASADGEIIAIKLAL